MAAFPNASRKTRIMATLGPATDHGEVLRGMLEAGVSVLRIDLACISRESALKAVYAIRSISTELKRPISLLLETQISPGHAADPAAFSDSTWDEIRFGLECGVDWLAVSAGQKPYALRQLRQFLSEQKRNTVSLLARIGDRPDFKHIDQIIDESDGVIFSVENSDNEDPALGLVAGKCANARKLAVIAIREEGEVIAALSARPDALLVAEGFHAGSDLLERVRALDGLIRREESKNPREAQPSIPLGTEQDKSVAAAVRQASELSADSIVLFTRSGHSACLCAALRPCRSRIVAFTPDARLARRLRLHYAVEPVVLPFFDQPAKTLQAAEKVMLSRKLAVAGATVVFVTDILDQGQRISSVQVRTIGKPKGKVGQ